MTKYRVTVALANGKKIRSMARFNAEDAKIVKEAASDETRLVSVSFSMGLWRSKVTLKASEISAVFIGKWLI